MVEPLGIAASLLAVTTAALQTTRSLYETVNRFKDRDKTLRRLQNELLDLTTILDSLLQVPNAEQPIFKLIQGPVERCSQICREFEESMSAFRGKSKPGLRDWTKMEFMRGDINEFIDTVAGYKSTISVGLGTITMLVTMPLSALGSTDIIPCRIPPKSLSRFFRSIMRWCKIQHTILSSIYGESMRR